MDQTTHDLAILGGGPAGMSAALIAGRCRLDTAILNEEKPRNRVTAASHGFLTRDGTHPLELLRIGKEQLGRYPSVAYLNDKAIAVGHHDGGFLIQRAAGPDIHARRLIIATGYKDDVDGSDLPGLKEVYGRSVFPCPFCDGFEHSDQRLAIFGAEGVEHFAPLIRMWSDDVQVFTNGRSLDDAVRGGLESHGVPVHEGRITAMQATPHGHLQLVQMADSAVERDAGFLLEDISHPATEFANDLGVAKKENDWGMMAYDADEQGKTAVPGIYIIGDARTGFSGLIAAASEGAQCVEFIVHDIAQERWGAA